MISLASLLLGLLVGLILAIARDSGVTALGVLAKAYLWLFRGTPVLLQIVFAFYVLPSFGIVLSRFTCAVLALGLNEGAYIAEIIRAGLRAVRAGSAQGRARSRPEAVACDATGRAAAGRCIIIPPIGSQFISMLKLTALVEVIGVQELLLVATRRRPQLPLSGGAVRCPGTPHSATTMFMADAQSQRQHGHRGKRREGTHKAKGRAGRLDHSSAPA